MLSSRQYQEICKIGGGEDRCRYLDVNNNGCQCLKLVPTEKKEIDKKTEEYLVKRKSTAWSIYPIFDSPKPLGDNCKGFLALKNVTVGFDQKS